VANGQAMRRDQIASFIRDPDMVRRMERLFLEAGMGAGTPIRLGQIEVVISASLVYSTPKHITVVAEDIDICNTSGAPVSVSVFLVPSGGTPSAANAILFGAPVAVGGFIQWRGGQVLRGGDSLHASASALGLTLTASGSEV